MSAAGPFVSAQALNELGAAADSRLVTVDCRFNLLEPHAGFGCYLDGHIPGARYAHLDRDLSRRPGPGEGRHPLPSKAAFCRYLGAAGIDKDTFVVAYDDQGGALAARLWWLLGWIGHRRRALLNGGIAAWTRAGFELTAAMPMLTTVRYEPGSETTQPVLDTASVTSFIGNGGRLLDARAERRFAGFEEPIDPVAGHVPGAVNLPVSSLLQDDGLLRPVPALAAEIGRRLPERPAANTAAMCGSGVTACFLIAACEAAGIPPPRLYAGSWSEWIRDDSRPVATGTGPALLSDCPEA